MRGTTVVGAALILFGIVLLLEEFNLYTPGKGDLVILGSAVLGLFLLFKGFSNPEYKGILGGTFFILLALSLFAMKQGFYPISDRSGIGILLIDLGIANLVYYLVSRKKHTNLVAGIILMAIGSPFLIIHFGIMPAWLIGDLAARYWPVLLIIVGVVIIIERGWKNRTGREEVNSS